MSSVKSFLFPAYIDPLMFALICLSQVLMNRLRSCLKNVKSTDHSSYRVKQKIQRFTASNHLEQLITSTRISEKSCTAIDLIFTNISHRIVDHGVIPSVINDHFLIYCSIKSGVPKAKSKTIEYRSYLSYTKEAFLNEL